MEPVSAPLGTDQVPAVPHGRTALRLEWKFLPPEVRALVEDELGGPVVQADSRTSGFTPGFASVVTAANGRTAFVKAASKIAQAQIADSYAEEILKICALGDLVPAAELAWFSRDEAWVVLGYEAVACRLPRRPWRAPDLVRSLDLAERIALHRSELPDDLELAPLIADLPELVSGWDQVPRSWPHHDEAAELARSLEGLPADHLVHADLRDDNILLADDGRTLACDWNWPALGTPWQDAVDLLVAAHGDGLDVEAVISSREHLASVAPQDIDAWLAGICGFMLTASQRPVPATSPHLRTHNRWTAEAAWSWLSRRRGWTP